MKRNQRGARKECNATEQKSLQKVAPNALVQKSECRTTLAGLAKVQKEVLKVLAQSIGLKDEKLALTLIDQMNKMQAGWSIGDIDVDTGTALATMLEMKPESITEGFLAVQMVGVHHTALRFLHRASIPGQSPESIDTNLSRATSLMRLYSEQAEAMLKLKGKTGQQKVTVEHVHVHEGGQAIVGAVSAAGPRPGKGG